MCVYVALSVVSVDSWKWRWRRVVFSIDRLHTGLSDIKGLHRTDHTVNHLSSSTLSLISFSHCCYLVASSYVYSLLDSLLCRSFVLFSRVVVSLLLVCNIFALVIVTNWSCPVFWGWFWICRVAKIFRVTAMLMLSVFSELFFILTLHYSRP